MSPEFAFDLGCQSYYHELQLKAVEMTGEYT